MRLGVRYPPSDEAWRSHWTKNYGAADVVADSSPAHSGCSDGSPLSDGGCSGDGARVLEYKLSL
ncbi:hypothetical protein HETIRDRAFT_148423 [Heterobasidion irregulare TC 32-1]|uniref:Uncharacterized protein n=1 Tax=Heterobasidion irregulare (strain TC 32-1) TaxID=747525 RepID=W4KAA3_HETIT|nr:uncharacterized protein HETIRDRAFT_148423 [Heterobasidion irregulare TC 32-1]ETW82713.1 hypothetical protein HETIRDRAFT_148423 [Heterobasidion irregulare TC 32-1]